ncbi:BZIP domain-containing protein [Mycena chlorophos]|uniref:BZIP domain-containing protein n=1 Tax=Mycena chlorophos TaxID=658473 RepID=A0A8H6TIL6_MYCCL|nr:BZIP domain-containing protein [Mycena chlorophos]
MAGVKPRWTSSALFGNCNGPELRSKAPSRLPFAPAWPPTTRYAPFAAGPAAPPHTQAPNPQRLKPQGDGDSDDAGNNLVSGFCCTSRPESQFWGESPLLSLSAAHNDPACEQLLTTRRSTYAPTADAFTADDAVAPPPPARFHGSQDKLASKGLPAATPREHRGDYDALTMVSSSQEDTAKQTERFTGTSPILSLLDEEEYGSDTVSPSLLSASPASEVQSLDDDFLNDSAYAAEPLIEADDYLPSPHMQMDFDFSSNNPNTSPLDTPYSAFLSTPLMGVEGDEFDPPVMTREVEDALAGELFAFTDDGEDVVPVGVKLPLPAGTKLDAFTPTSPMLDDFDSPLTNPAASFPNTPIIPPLSPASPLPVRRQPARKTRVVAGVNGTRKNITPAHLIPLDAPIQPRTYRLPSSTSRKAVPASSRKRTRSAAFADDEDYDVDDDDGDYTSQSRRRAGGGVSAGEAQRILDKRRQNTLAARKSRRRKLEHVQELESTVVELRGLVTRWMERARMAQGMLREKGTMIDFAED